MGVQTLWFMPINSIGKLDRKGAMGSHYAVAYFTAVNPEFGTLEDWKTPAKHAHERATKVIIDWVPNHAGADHNWVTQHPGFFIKDSAAGKPAIPFDWTDTRQLYYKNPVMEISMINAMKYWIADTDIDGCRCDVAWNVPETFWAKCIPQLRKMKQIFMLAEGDRPYLLKSGFDAYYPWEIFHKMVDIAAGKSTANSLDSVLSKYDSAYPANAIPMYFTSNHKENSWNKADYANMPGAKHASFAVFTQTMKNTVPLVYSDQEEPFLDSISFFYKDTISFAKFQRAKLYTTLQKLRSSNPALAANASFKKVLVGDEKALYAYVREAGGKMVFVILNLSAKEQTIKVTDTSLQGEPYNVFMGTKEPLKGTDWKIKPWGYVVYEY